MRLFPRTARRRLLAATVACTMALGALAVPLAMADDRKDLKDKQKHAQQEVRHAQHELQESSAGVQKAQAALEQARADLAVARGDYQAASAKLDAAELLDQQMQADLEAAEARLVEAQQELADGRAALAAQRLELTDTITSIYEQGDPQLLAFASLLKARSTTELTRQEAFNDVVVNRQAQAYDDLHAAEVLLEVREGQVSDARDAVEVKREAAADHLVEMQRLEDAAEKARDRVVALVATRSEARAAALQARAKDLRELRAAKKAEERIKQQILAAMRRARGGYRGPTNGLFIRPVSGSVSSPFGYRVHPIYHYYGLHNGTDFGVACGEGMRAIAAGTVIAKYFDGVYGNRLFVSLGTINGKNITAVYNHATGYRVGVGERVSQGEVVGYVGSTGWSTGCHLHFTLLQNGNPVNPMAWLP